MARFLRRSASTEAPASEQTEQPNPPAAPKQAPAQTRTQLQQPVAPPSRAPSRRGGRRRSPSNGSNEPAPNSSTGSAPKPAQRRSGRRPAQDSKPTDPTEQMLALLERQTALLEQQRSTIEQLAESQMLLTETLLGRRGDADAPARIEVLPRLAIFVDVPNILYGAESSGVRLNWGKVADFLSHGRTLVRAIAYAPISDDPTARTENERFVVPFLDHGYRIATKPLKRFSGGSVKANFDVELAIDVLTMSDRVDVIVLVSGDGDFRRLVEIVGARGVRVEVMAFGKSTSADLRQVADRYIDIASHADRLRD